MIQTRLRNALHFQRFQLNVTASGAQSRLVGGGASVHVPQETPGAGPVLKFNSDVLVFFSVSEEEESLPSAAAAASPAVINQPYRCESIFFFLFRAFNLPSSRVPSLQPLAE